MSGARKLLRTGRATLGSLAVASLAVVVVLHPGLAVGANPCAGDIERFCAKVPIGGGRIQACLKEHETDLSPECAARYQSLEKQMGSLAASCREDISRFCSDVSPGEGRIGRCLAAHRSELSPVCKDRMQKARSAAQ
jgi:hypothetical protein